MTSISPFMPMRWGFVFLHWQVKLSERQRLDLVRLAIKAYMDDLSSIDFDWPACHGALTVESDAVALGSFAGQRFRAEVHVPEGSGSVEFLVTEAQLRAAQGQVAEA